MNEEEQRLWDAARSQGFNDGYQAGVVHALSEAIDFLDSKGFDIPWGMRSAILSLIDGKDA